MRVFLCFQLNMSDHKICELVVIDTVDGEDNLEEKTREVADMFDRMCHFG